MQRQLAAARKAYDTILQMGRDHPRGDAWLWLAAKVQLDQDPGACIALIASILAGMTKFDATSLPDTASSLAELIAHLMSQPEWRSGSWVDSANRSRSGDGFTGSVLDRPVLAGLVSRSLANREEQDTIDALRLLVVVALVDGRDTATAAAVVANALRKAARFSDWRHVVLAVPAPLGQTPFLVWAAAVRTYLEGAKPPQDAVDLPVFSIREFFQSLDALAATALDSRSRLRQQTVLFGADVDEAEPVGRIHRRGDDLGGEHGRASRRAHRQCDPDNADRANPIQAMLFFDESADAGTEPATLMLSTADEVAPDEQAPAYLAQAVEHRYRSYRFVELQLRLRWAWEHLNRHDLAVVRASIAEDLSSPGPRFAGALFAALILATGRRVGDVGRLRIGRPSSGEDFFDSEGRWRRTIMRPPKAWRPAASLGEALQAGVEQVTLALPEHLANAIRELVSAHPGARTVGEALHVGDDEVLPLLSRWLDPLRAAHPSSRLTHGRLSRALALELTAQLGDEVVVHKLVGSAEDVPPIASYYAAVPTSVLHAAYQQAVSALLGDAPVVAITSAAAERTGPSVLKEERRRSLADALYAIVATSRGATLVEQHNAYARYVLWLLLAVSGHRPVTDPFEALDLFDLERGLVLVADKFVHDANQARLVPLPRLAIEMVAAYREHLLRLSQLLCPEHPALAARIDTTVRPSGPRALPFFFLLTAEFEVERISEGVLTESMSATLPGLPANHFRRELSSYAAAQGWPYDLVREMLGHVDQGQPAIGDWSCLSSDDLLSLQGRLDGFAADFGWRHVDSPLLALTRPRTRPSGMSGTHEPLPIALGTALRQQQLARSHKRAVSRMEAALRAWCRNRRWSRLEQADVDALQQQVLHGRQQPSSLAEIAMFDRIARLLSWVKRRYGLSTLRVPAARRVASTAQAALAVGTLQVASRGRALEDAFVRRLHARARAGRGAMPAVGMAEAIVSLSVLSLVSDVHTLRALLRGDRFELLAVDGLGLQLEVHIGGSGSRRPRQDSGPTATRRYPLHPLSAALLARASNADAAHHPRAYTRLVKQLRHSVEGAGAAELSNAAQAMQWLCEQVSALARLVVPGHLAAYLDGSSMAVGVPRADWLRWMTGARAACEPVVKKAPVPPAAQPPTSEDRPAEPIHGGDSGASDATSRAAGIALHRAVRDAIRSVRHTAVETRAESNRSANQIEKLVPKLLAVVKQHDQSPEIARAVVFWFVELLLNGLNGDRLRTSSCERYYSALVLLLIDLLSGVLLREANDTVWATAYSTLMDAVPPSGQAMVFGRLRAFHSFLVRQYGVPEVDWHEVVPEGLLRSHVPDAGLVLWPDYERALHLLLHDETADLRERRLQACVLLLMFRLGLRIGEALALRERDLHCEPDGTWVVLVRPSDYRELKTDSGIRQVPLIGPLSEVEAELLEGWASHARELVGDDRCGALFSLSERPRHLVDRARITTRIADALRAATGDRNLRPHHLRHGLATRLVVLMSLEALPADPKQAAILRRLLGPCEPAAARRLLLDRPERSKRGLWALAVAIGHASPRTTLRWYAHGEELLLALQMAPRFTSAPLRLDAATASYVLGVRLPASSRKLEIDGPLVRRHHAARVVRAESLVDQRSKEPVLPARRVVPEMPVAPIEIDRLLDITYRRGRVDGVERVLMAPISRIEEELRADHALREEAGFDLPRAAWAPTRATGAVSHARAGTRSAVETERVRTFLRGLGHGLKDPRWLATTAQVTQLWRRRYRADSTALVLASVAEAQEVARWCVGVGIDVGHLAILVPRDCDEMAATCRSSLNGHGVHLATQVDRLPGLRSPYRKQVLTRLGFQLRENDQGPLTHMTQWHRVMHVLSVWLVVRRRSEAGSDPSSGAFQGSAGALIHAPAHQQQRDRMEVRP